jgi:hypothetical protein
MVMTWSLSLELGGVIKPLSCEAPVAVMCAFRGDSFRNAGIPASGTRSVSPASNRVGTAVRRFGPMTVVLQRCSHRLHITHTPASLRRGWVSSEPVETSLREDQTVRSTRGTKGRTEVWCLVGKPVGPLPPCLGTELVRSGVVSSATTASPTVSVRVSPSRASRLLPGAGAENEGTSKPSLSF